MTARPYAANYRLGFLAARHGLEVDACPYTRASAQRAAWLDGYVAGARAALLAETVSESKDTRLPRGHATRAIVQRRWQRRAMRRAGGGERYVDRRLREIAGKTPTK